MSNEVTCIVDAKSLSKTVADEEKTLQFMVERAHEESKLFWLRTNVFLLINAGFLGLVIQVLLKRPVSREDLTLLAMTSIVAVILTVLWYFLLRITQYYNAVWMTDARRLVAIPENADLLNRYYYSLGIRSVKGPKRPQARLLKAAVEDGEKLPLIREDMPFRDFTRPYGCNAMTYMQITVGLFAILWLSSGIYTAWQILGQ